jgi:lipopolysaccharide biosynthesis glycosyltransferase
LFLFSPQLKNKSGFFSFFFLVDLLDSNIVVDDVEKLWSTNLGLKTIGAPEYCHVNFTKYFTVGFWSEPSFAATIEKPKVCYFNTGVIVMDLVQWKKEGYTNKIEIWMEIQKSERIYEFESMMVGSLRAIFSACDFFFLDFFFLL